MTVAIYLAVLTQLLRPLIVMPHGTKVVAAESWGISAWTKPVKLSVVLGDGSPHAYFLKARVTRTPPIRAY